MKGKEHNMYIIAGLGNPSPQYDKTRHNVGFDTIDAIAQKYQISMNINKHKSICGTGYIQGQKVLLQKPQTFMNLSGEAVAAAVNFYKIDPEEELIVIYDDISLEVGRLRLRKKGSAGGHNGIKNIMEHLHTQVFKRMKLGVGEKPKGWDLADYVLSRFDKADRDKIEEGIERAAEAVEVMVTQDMAAAMNEFNG